MKRQKWIQRLLLGGASLALLAAAVLVMTLQRDAEARQQGQTAKILEQLCWQSARVMRQRLHDQFQMAVSETIEGIGHPEMIRYDLPRIASHFNAGRKDVYVDRFFLWSRRMKSPPADQVVFYRPFGEDGDGEGGDDFGSPIMKDGQILGSLERSPALGRLIWTRAQEFLPQKRSFAVVDERFEGRQFQLLIHYLWHDEQREQLGMIIGYTVDFNQLRSEALPAMVKVASTGVIDSSEEALQVSIRDDTGRIVLGEDPPADHPSATLTLEMMFMSREMAPFRVPGTKVPTWAITVSADVAVAEAAGSGWLFASVALLIFVGLACAMVLDRQRQRLATMQSDFVAHVSHQLKTPLALLSGAAETLGRGRVSSPDKIREYAGMVHAQATRLSSLVEQAIIFSTVETAGLRFEVVDVTGLVRDVVDGFRRGIPDTLVVRFTADAGVPLVKGDPSALEQVVWNLLENAMKYSRGDNVIDVGVTTDNRQAVIFVRDRGEGIQSADLPRIFDQFYRGQTNQQRRGFGLGLAYVQKVVVAHGGHITVNSEEGSGSEFRVSLPPA
jgi:nitrogen-specific signal transduction histidine kinase